MVGTLALKVAAWACSCQTKPGSACEGPAPRATRQETLFPGPSARTVPQREEKSKGSRRRASPRSRFPLLEDSRAPVERRFGHPRGLGGYAVFLLIASDLHLCA